MRQSLRSRITLIASAVAVLAVLASLGQAYALDHPDSDEVSLGVDTTEREASLHPDGIAIHSTKAAALADPTPVYSINLQGLTPPETVRVDTPVAASYCIGSDINGQGNWGSPCRTLPSAYRYDLKLEVHLFKAAAPGDTSDGATFLDGFTPTPQVCSYELHHCPVREAVETTLTGNAKPYINAEIIAWRSAAGQACPAIAPNCRLAWNAGDRLELEGDCYEPNLHPGHPTTYEDCNPVIGNVADREHPTQLADTKGQLSVLRLGSSYVTPPPASSTRIDNAGVEIDEGQGADFTVVHSAELINLAPGDVVEADGTVHITGSGFDHSATSWWVLSPDPAEDGKFIPTTGTGPATFGRYVAAKAGPNCLDPNHPSVNDMFVNPNPPPSQITIPRDGSCSIGQSGAVKVPSCTTATPPVCPPSTMYLNYVVQAKDGSTTASPSATIDSGTFNMTCDPQPRPVGTVVQPCSFLRK
jgi:hypothetical protein